MENCLRRQPAKRLEQAFIGGVAENDEAHGTHHVGPAFGKECFPLEVTQQVEQFRLTGKYDDSAFIEVGQGIARRAARHTGRRHRPPVAPAEDPLGLRKTQPDQRIEEIMPVAGARLDFAGVANPAFVGEAVRLRRHETDAPAIRRKDGKRSASAATAAVSGSPSGPGGKRSSQRRSGS